MLWFGLVPSFRLAGPEYDEIIEEIISALEAWQPGAWNPPDIFWVVGGRGVNPPCPPSPSRSPSFGGGGQFSSQFVLLGKLKYCSAQAQFRKQRGQKLFEQNAFDGVVVWGGLYSMAPLTPWGVRCGGECISGFLKNGWVVPEPGKCPPGSLSELMVVSQLGPVHAG